MGEKTDDFVEIFLNIMLESPKNDHLAMFSSTPNLCLLFLLWLYLKMSLGVII